MPMELVKWLVEQTIECIPDFLRHAFLEWVMIILLFVDEFLAFISNEFTQNFALKTSCLLCKRIDHVLVPCSASFYYNDSICNVHKKDDGEPCEERSGMNSWFSCCGEPLKAKPTKKILRNLSTKSPRMAWLASKTDELRETPRSRYAELKFMSDIELEFPQNDNQGKEDIRATITPFKLIN